MRPMIHADDDDDDDGRDGAAHVRGRAHVGGHDGVVAPAVAARAVVPKAIQVRLFIIISLILSFCD